MNFTNIKRFFTHTNIRKQVWRLLNAICIVILLYNAIDMALDYLKFNYSIQIDCRRQQKWLRFAND